MRPTPIPDDELWPGARRVTLAGPSGDLTGDGSSVDQAAAVEITLDRHPIPADANRTTKALYDVGQDTGAPRCCIRLALEPGDLEKLAAGGVVWLGVYGPLPVFTVDVKAPGE
jgi:hypothetical protein